MKAEQIKLRIDPRIYSLSAVKKAIYDFTDRAFIEITIESDNAIGLSVRLKELSTPNTIQELLNHILDHQVRIDLEAEFGSLRDIIAAQAFTPCSSLELEKLLTAGQNEK